MAGCDEFPRDPDETLNEVRGGTMAVGVLHKPPWVDLSGAEPAGIEVDLIGVLAEQLGARIEWSTPGDADVLDALKERQLDIVIGGLTESDPWNAHVAFTRPYFRADTVVAGKSPPPLESIAGLEIAVTPGTAEAAHVTAHGAIPVSKHTPGTTPAQLSAKPFWEIERGEAALYVLHSDHHVVAVPQGENAWLLAVDRFLDQAAPDIAARLRAARE